MTVRAKLLCAITALIVAVSTPASPVSAHAQAGLTSLSSIVASARRRTLPPVYDTSVGNGVDSNGFAKLPLYTPGTDGADLAAAAPTIDGGNAVTYNSGTRSLTDTGSAAIARWPGILTTGQNYHVVMYVTQNSYATLIIQNASGSTQFTAAYTGNGTAGQQYLVDGVFTATGPDLVLQRVNDTFNGSIQIVKVAQTTSSSSPARRFYVCPTGSDSNTGLQAENAATPFATVAKATKFVSDGRGDQVLLCQGGNFTRGLANLSLIGGKSPAYPFVVQSYDPADPTNEAKFGRATGNARPVVNPGGADMSNGFIQPGASDVAHPYVAIRGLEFNPGNIADAELTITRAGGGGTTNYLLFENDVFAYTDLSMDFTGAASRASHIVIRNSASFGQMEPDQPRPGPLCGVGGWPRPRGQRILAQRLERQRGAD